MSDIKKLDKIRKKIYSPSPIEFDAADLRWCESLSRKLLYKIQKLRELLEEER